MPSPDSIGFAGLQRPQGTFIDDGAATADLFGPVDSSGFLAQALARGVVENLDVHAPARSGPVANPNRRSAAESFGGRWWSSGDPFGVALWKAARRFGTCSGQPSPPSTLVTM